MNRQLLVNSQVDINRAVWAANCSDYSHTTFKNETERNEYIKQCAQQAIKNLQEYLSNKKHLKK